MSFYDTVVTCCLKINFSTLKAVKSNKLAVRCNVTPYSYFVAKLLYSQYNLLTEASCQKSLLRWGNQKTNLQDKKIPIKIYFYSVVMVNTNIMLLLDPSSTRVVLCDTTSQEKRIERMERNLWGWTPWRTGLMSNRQ